MSESITKKKGMGKKPSFFGKKGKSKKPGFSLFKKQAPMVEDTDMDGE